MLLPLSQSSGAGDIFGWALVLIVCVLVLFVAVVLLKRWLKKDDITSGPGFTLSDLRQLVAEGKMTKEEFEKAKLAIVGTAKAKPPANPSVNPPTNRP
jgi:uncharacterized membrane protein